MLWLEKKYLSMVVSHLDVAKWKGDTTLNHRCPYCGDSQKNQHKARGYHFVIEQSYVYKCHNCGKSTSTINFLKEHFPVIHKEYMKEWLTEKGLKPKKKKLPSSSKFKFQAKDETLNTSNIMTVENLKFLMKPCSEVSVAREYLEERHIPSVHHKELWYSPAPQQLSILSKKYEDRVLGTDPRIIIPFFNRENELIGLSGRAMNDSPLRYMTMKFHDDEPLIYNLHKVDIKKTIYVTEGPIDSLFLPNAISVAGSDFTKLDDSIKENAILVYDNEPRNVEILKKIDTVINEGWKVCIWNDRRVSDLKDINDMVSSGLSSEQIVSIINECSFSGLSAKAKFMEYKKV
tara:strand:- start:11471 stop:12508 length:1038 start_codon:yes stop_codon:yes gene_type:complete